MKKTLIILFSFLAANVFAYEYTDSLTNIKLTLPDSYKCIFQDTSNFIIRASFEGEGAKFLELSYIQVENIDKKKAREASDTVAFNLKGWDVIVPEEEGGEYDRAAVYFNPTTQKYWKLYKYVHFDGVVYLRAVNTKNDFTEADTIANSYDRSLGAGFWKAILVGIIIALPTIFMWIAGAAWKEERKKSLLYLVISLIIAIVEIIFFPSLWLYIALLSFIGLVLGLSGFTVIAF